MLELGSSATPSRSMLSRSGPFPSVSLLLLFPFSRRETLSRSPPLLDIFLPWRRRLGERRPSPLPATSASSRYAARSPLLFPCAVRDGARQTLTKLSVFGSESSYNILSYLLTWISFARTRIIGCTCVHPCPMLGPPPAWDLPLFSNSNANSSLPFIFLRRKLVVYRRKVHWPW